MIRLIPFAWLFVVAASAAAQRPAASQESAVLAVEKQWNDARAHADVATLERILVDDWTVTHANGTTDSKHTYLADLKSGARAFTGEVTERDLTVRFFGDTAIVAGSSDSSVTLNGQRQGGSLHFTRVFVRQNGAWKMAVTQATTRQ
jgi:ketosteroid isomerase-like protein